MQNLDTRLLQVFDAIYKTRSVSRAADVSSGWGSLR